MASFDPARRFVSSPFFSSWTLAIIRGTFAVFGLCTTLTVLALNAAPSYRTENGPFLFYSYFTTLSYIGLTSYYVAAATHTAVFAATKGRTYLLAEWSKVFQTLHVILFATITTFPIVVTVVYWTLLSSWITFTTPLSLFSSISQHALNTPFALFEILLTNAPPLRWIHLPVCLVLLGLYLCLAYITHATQGVYVYEFLNPNESHALLAGFIVGIALGGCIAFTLVKGLMMGRDKLVKKWWPERVPQIMESKTELRCPAHNNDETRYDDVNSPRDRDADEEACVIDERKRGESIEKTRTKTSVEMKENY